MRSCDNLLVMNDDGIYLCRCVAPDSSLANWSEYQEGEGPHVDRRSATLGETGCLEYQAYVDRKNTGTFFIFEKWQDQAALDADFVSPHMAEFGVALGALGIRAMDVKKYGVSSEGSVP